jgi:hypothetical protein
MKSLHVKGRLLGQAAVAANGTGTADGTPFVHANASRRSVKEVVAGRDVIALIGESTDGAGRQAGTAGATVTRVGRGVLWKIPWHANRAAQREEETRLGMDKQRDRALMHPARPERP